MSKSTLDLAFGVVFVLGAGCGAHTRSPGNGGGADGSNGGGSGQDAAVCATSMVKAQQVPLDLYIMLDKSNSMTDAVAGGGTKWSAVTGAIDTFVQQPGLDGVSVGLQYFGVPSSTGPTCSAIFCTQTSDCGASACGPCQTGFCLGTLSSIGDSCTASDYAMPAVEIAPLPGVGGQITSSIAMHSPTTGTPTSAALQGAVDHAETWSQSHPGDVVAVIFATDGDPSECDTDLGHIDAIAAAGDAATPKILTYVIGVGSSLAALNGIAAAGGTIQAFLVDTGGNVNQQFLAAMNAIRGEALGCVYSIPLPTDGSAPNYGAVNVVYTNSSGLTVTFPYVADKAHCPMTGNAWYYDDPQNPMHILLCDPACALVQSDTGGEVDITLGCATVIE